MSITRKVLLLTVASLSFPVLAFAGPLPGFIINVNRIFGNLFDFVWPFITGFGIAVFIFIGFVFLFSLGKPEAWHRGGRFLLYGVIGIAVLVISFSIVDIVSTMFQ